MAGGAREPSGEDLGGARATRWSNGGVTPTPTLERGVSPAYPGSGATPMPEQWDTQQESLWLADRAGAAGSPSRADSGVVRQIEFPNRPDDAARPPVANPAAKPCKTSK